MVLVETLNAKRYIKILSLDDEDLVYCEGDDANVQK